MNRQISLLILLAIAAVGGGVWLTMTSQTSDFSVEKLFSSGASDAESVVEITLENSQKVILQASLEDGNWLAKLPDTYTSYPLDKRKLAGFIQAIVNAKLIEAKTSKQKNYHHLGVESIDNVDSLATLVSLKMARSAKPWQVLLGNRATMGEGMYVRFPTSLQSWLIDHEIDVPSDEFEWLQRPLLTVESAEIESLSRTDGKAWRIVKAKDNDFSLSDVADNREVRYPGIESAYVTSLLELDFERVLPLDSAQWQQAQIVAKFDYVLTDARQLHIDIAKLETDYYLQVSSQTIDAYYLQWTYKISAFSAQQLLKTKEDFLVELAPVNAAKSVKQKTDEGEAPF